MKEIIGYVGSGKSTFLRGLKTSDRKHVDIGLKVRLFYVLLFLLFKPNKYKYLFYFNSIKNAYVYMYLIGLKFFEKYSKYTFFVDQGFAQLLVSELYVNENISNIILNELLKNSNDNKVYSINISKKVSFKRFLERKLNKSRVVSHKDWFHYSNKLEEVLRLLNIEYINK